VADEYFFEGVPRLLIIFGEIPSRVGNLMYKRCISDYSSDVLELHVGRVSGANAWLTCTLDQPCAVISAFIKRSGFLEQVIYFCLY